MSTPAGVETRGPAIIAVAVVFPILSSIFIAGRVYSRVRVTNFFGIDDWCAIATLVVAFAYSVCLGIWTTHGLGMHEYDMTPAIKEEYNKWLLISSEFYVTGLLGYKTAILLLYLRIFSAHMKFRIACYAVLAFNTSYLLANLLLQIFSCTPVPRFWDSDLPGSCVPLTAPDIVFGAMLMLSDFAIALLPIPVIWKLQMSKRDKILISLVFLSGLIAFTMAAVRWILAVVDLTAEDRTWIAGLAFLFSIIEVNTGIICGCSATLRPLFKFARQHSSRRKSSADARNGKKSPSHETDFSGASGEKKPIRAPPGTMDMSKNTSAAREESPASNTSSNTPLSKVTTARPSLAEALPEDLAFSEDRLNLPREGTKYQPELRPRPVSNAPPVLPEIGGSSLHEMSGTHFQRTEME